jgi:protein-tyrosine phosphatase
MAPVRIIDNIYIGSIYDSRIPIPLTDPLVINVAGEINNRKAHYQYSLTDDDKTVDYHYAYNVWDEIVMIIQNNPKRRIIIHCQMGKCRSVATVIYYIMKTRGVTVNEAKKLFITPYDCSHVNRDYMNMLYELE